MLVWLWACTAQNEYCIQTTETELAQSFVEVTQEWGLEDIHADGIRVSAVDYNGDNWPDLFILDQHVLWKHLNIHVTFYGFGGLFCWLCTL